MPNAAVSRLILAKYNEQLVIDTARDALAEIGGKVSCGVLFCSADYREHLADFLELTQLHAHIPTLIGCSGTGLVGTGAEAENVSGFSLLLLHLPGTRVTSLAFDSDTAWDDPDAIRRATPGVEAGAWIVMADPTSVIIEPWLVAWGEAFPGVPCVGGLGSGGRDGGDILVFRDRELIEGGAVALGLSGGVEIHTLVSQGCRPIGEPLPVTGAEENIIHTIGGRSAYKVLDDAFQGLSDRDKERARGNLFAGIAMREDRENFHRGDFLIRNIIGADPESGAVIVGTIPRIGQTLQWQFRDGKAADADLRQRAGALAATGVKPFASLLFACGGRGRALFGAPNHDAAVIAECFTPHPATGFFCNGEIGPVGGRSFVHGYTASALLLA